MFAGEHRPGAAEADGDFVMNQVYAVAVASLAQQFKVHGMVHAHAAGTLDQGFDNDRGHRGMVFGQGLFHDREHVPRVLFPAHAVGAQVAIGAGHLDGVEQQCLIGFSEQRYVADRHRGDSFAVVTVGQGDKAFLVRLATVDPIVKAHFQCNFDAR
ncbi:hypothetical protein D9M71_521330 [compost metagenome]